MSSSLFPLRQAAQRILDNTGEWTAGDAKACAEFVVAAQDDFKHRVAEAREAMEQGDDAVVAYLQDERIDLVQARAKAATFLSELLNAAHATHPGPFCPVCGLVGGLQEALRNA